MNTIVVGEIEKSFPLDLFPTPYQSPVWKYDLWVTDYEPTLPFMAETDSDYPSEIYSFSSLIIDYAPYYNATSLAECVATPGSWFASGPTLYTHGNDDRPIWLSYAKQYGRIYGFTNKGPRRFNQINYLPILASVPQLSEQVDPITYSRMAYNGGSVEFRNEDEYFDQLVSVFGNDFNLKIGEDDGQYSSLKNVVKYWIENYAFGIRKTTFALKDKRELLSAKAPNTYFTAAAYPDIEDNKLGKIIPDAFGPLFGVPGICVNGKATASAKVFKFGAVITSLSHIYVFKDEQWVEVPAASTNFAAGEITLSTGDAHVDGSTSKGIVKVKADGVFRPETNPGDIIAKLNEIYEGIQYLPGNYKIDEWESELGPLAGVGLYLDSAKDVAEWIEQLQNSSTIGFQYMVDYDRITARLDNPNRDIAAVLHAVEIRNVEDVEVDNNATQYASSALIRYAHDQESGDALQIINDEYRESVLEVHRKEYVYETDSLLPDAPSAAEKAAVIMDDQKTIRPIYRGVKVAGTKWCDRRLYDIIEAEISIPGVHVVVPYPFDVDVIFYGSLDVIEIRPGLEDYNFIVPGSSIQELLVPIKETETAADTYKLIVPNGADYEELRPMGVRGRKVVKNTDREFVGTVRCQIVGRSLDLENCEVSFDLRQRDYSDVVAAILEG